MGKYLSIVAVGVTTSSHAAAVVRVGASCGQGVGNGVIVVHPLSMACAHGPEGCPQLALRNLMRSRLTLEQKAAADMHGPNPPHLLSRCLGE
jgi:hypothetical protein